MTLEQAYALLKAGKMEGSVQVHPWSWCEDGGQAYCHAPCTPDGWCVYTRIETPNDRFQPFDLLDEVDFFTLEDAIAEAEKRAEALGLEWEQY